MVTCRAVILQLWDYLDGELRTERAQEIAGHLARCGRCRPLHQFEFAFLKALARQADWLPAESSAFAERLRRLIRILS